MTTPRQRGRLLSRHGLTGALIALMAASCSTPPTQDPDVLGTVVETGSSIVEHTDEIVFNNCGSTVAISGARRVTRTLAHQTQWEYGTEVGVGGEVSVAGQGKLNVDATIAGKYGETASRATENHEEISYEVSPGTQAVYLVHWEEVTREGYVLAGQESLRFEYSDSLRFAGVSRRETPCEETTTTVAGQPEASTEMNRFVGTWVNVDPNTRGITRIVITGEGGFLTFNAFGKCHPRDCDWGKVRVPYQGEPVRVPYLASFKTTDLVVARSGDVLVVRASTHFTDQSGRSDRVNVYQFRQ